MKTPKPHKSGIDFATQRGLNQPITVIIERLPSGPFAEDRKTLVEFGIQFESYRQVDAFCESSYAKSVLRETRKYYKS